MRFSELDRARIGVWGAGREIRSFATQLADHLPRARIDVVALDDPPGEDVRERLGFPDSRLALGAEAVAALGACEAIVRSPGVSIYRPELRALAARGIPITTATSLWLAERGPAGVIAVTGTKGKSTTAALLAHILRAAGRTAHLAGNIGAPALDLLDAPLGDLVVVELSSYQIADLASGPEIAVFTNLYREHLDWHRSDAAYRADKLRLLALPEVRARVLNGRDAQLLAACPAGVEEPLLFGTPADWDADARGIVWRGEHVALASADLPLRGEHNALNLCAALSAIGAIPVPLPPLPDALRSFHALPHRLEPLGEHDGIQWVDDSISTTPESTLAALESFPQQRVVLLGGGHDRSQDYTRLGAALAAREAAVVGLPPTGARLVAAARRAGIPAPRAVQAADMADAVELARELACPGATVLLSPAAPSYGSYRNFEERGEHFRRLVAELRVR
ncbi:MAG TPA: UDP-N-acetylmuramoyl-L-alanine--D-glutamate ligase [Solirubrobacteraceae bacterium]|jgi:UDP-N-acetylmuramoylalanine--D-glutamate ligase|nr:UDP-N-acetylmuramoyl-L-alanine--D-glutamate ligase [Solirubrobacteraceae bacterium]